MPINKTEMAKFTFSEAENRIYLASPYTHKHKDIMALRYTKALHSTAEILSKGYLVFSPIVHNHLIAVEHILPKDYAFWKDYSDSFLHNWAEAIVVLRLYNWEESIGVRAEIDLAQEKKLPVYYL